MWDIVANKTWFCRNWSLSSLMIIISYLADKFIKNFQGNYTFSDIMTPWLLRINFFCNTTKENGSHLLKWPAEEDQIRRIRT